MARNFRDLPAMRNATAAPKQVFGKHLAVTERRLEQVRRSFHIEPKGETCEAMEGLAEESEALIGDLDGCPVLDAALIVAARKIEHHETAAYGTLTSMPKAMDRSKALDSMARTLKEEKDAGAPLPQPAGTEPNPAAPGQQPANHPTKASRGTA